MATEEEILAEVEKLGRLSPDQENILYNISLKQDELGRESTNIFLSKLEGSPLYQPLIDREYITYEVFNHGTKHEVASLYVTLKGLRYCIIYADELSLRRKLDPAGAPWKEGIREKIGESLANKSENEKKSEKKSEGKSKKKTDNKVDSEVESEDKPASKAKEKSDKSAKTKNKSKSKSKE